MPWYFFLDEKTLLIVSASVASAAAACLAFGKAMRLKKNWQFRKVYDEGAKIVCPCAVVFYYINPEEKSGACFGVVASKRVGNAVKRNRAKRLLREAIRGFSGKFNHRDIWVVLVAKARIIDYTAVRVQDEIGQAFEQAGLITR